MWKNYLKVAVRNIVRDKGFSFIIGLGLAAGMAASLLILSYVRHELSYDRYHPHADRIVRVVEELSLERASLVTATTPAPFAPAIAAEFSEVQTAARFVRAHPSNDKVLVECGAVPYYEDGVFFTDATVFEVFSLPLLQGDPRTALRNPLSAVITARAAAKYFGTESPLGKTLTIHHLMGKADLEQKFPAFIAKHVGAEGQAVLHPRLQPVTSIHLHSHLNNEVEANGDILYVLLLSAAALCIILIAAANFMNLATARYTRRMKEVGLRKVVGADRPQLIAQFLGESVLTALLALPLALGIGILFQPAFCAMMGKNVVLAPLAGPLAFLSFLALTVLVGLGWGVYPAFFLFGLKPLAVLKGQDGPSSPRRLLRKALLVFQFAASTLLVISTLTVGQQVHFLRTKKLGFDKEPLVVLPLLDAGSRLKYETLKNELLGIPGVAASSASSGIPGRIPHRWVIRVEGSAADANAPALPVMMVDQDFLRTYGVDLVSGRDFSPEAASDVQTAILVNESTVKFFGWRVPLGQRLQTENKDGSVIGVVRDFHFQPLYEKVEPLVIYIVPRHFAYLTVRLRPGQIPETMAALQAAWKKVIPERPFEYFFLADDFDSRYRAEERMGKLSAAFRYKAFTHKNINQGASEMGNKARWMAGAIITFLGPLILRGQNGQEFRLLTENGIPVASNPSHPVPVQDGPQDISFKQEFCLGAVEGDSRYVFGPVIRFAVDDEGCIYVLDWRAKEVRKFDAKGRYLLSFGREGQGPGEFSSPEEIRFLASGQILVFEGESQRFSRFTKSGQLVTSGRFQNLMYSPYFGLSNGSIIATHVLRDSDKTLLTTGLYDDKGELMASLSQTESQPELPWPDRDDLDGRARRLAETFSRAAFRRTVVMALNEREEILFAVTDKYEIKIFTPQAKLKKIIRTELPFLPVRKEDRELFLEVILPKELSTWQRLGRPFQDKIKGLIRFPEKKPAFLSVIPMDDDFLMIVRDCPALGSALIDLFDSSGRFIIEKRLDFGISQGICKGGKLYTLSEDGSGNLSIKSYGIVPSPPLARH